MTMICRITDERIDTPWEEYQEVRTLSGINIYDLMAEDMSVWVGKNKEFGYVMEVENESGEIAKEAQIHPCAMESFAEFCRRFLHSYDTISEREG